MTLTSEEKELLMSVLKYYHKNEFTGITDYEKVIGLVEEVEEGIFAYPCPCQTIYLDDTFYAVEYGKQHIIDGNYYYDFNTNDNNNIAGTYTYICKYEWERNSIADQGGL